MESRKEQLRQETIAFDKSYPRVFRLFERFTFEKIRQGFQHYGAKAVMERVRWETDAGADSTTAQFKINNNFISFYARAFMKKHPKHKGFFRERKQKSEDRPERT